MDESRGLTHRISYWSRVEREEPTRLKEPIAMETKQLCLNCLPWPFLANVAASSDDAAAQSFAPLSCQRRLRLPSRTQWTARLFLMLLLGKNFARRRRRSRSTSMSASATAPQPYRSHHSLELGKDNNPSWISTWIPKMLSCRSSFINDWMCLIISCQSAHFKPKEIIAPLSKAHCFTVCT